MNERVWKGEIEGRGTRREALESGDAALLKDDVILPKQELGSHLRRAAEAATGLDQRKNKHGMRSKKERACWKGCARNNLRVRRTSRAAPRRRGVAAAASGGRRSRHSSLSTPPKAQFRGTPLLRALLKAGRPSIARYSLFSAPESSRSRIFFSASLTTCSGDSGYVVLLWGGDAGRGEAWRRRGQHGQRRVVQTKARLQEVQRVLGASSMGERAGARLKDHRLQIIVAVRAHAEVEFLGRSAGLERLANTLPTTEHTKEVTKGALCRLI